MRDKKVTGEQSYGQGHAESVLRSQHWRGVENSAAYLLPELREGLDVLDVGCGPGTITIDLARRVSPGRVVGIDISPSVVEQARENARAADVDNVTFEEGDVQALKDETRTFDVVHAHQVLLHLTDPVGALRAMLQMVRPGGILAARDTDYAAATWWPEDPRLDRWLEVYRAVAHGNGAEPDAGRRLLSWAHAAGATGVTPSASIWCHAGPEQRAWWGGLWADRILDSRIAEQALEQGVADRSDLEEISAGWREWAANPDGWFAIPHGEVICRGQGPPASAPAHAPGEGSA